MFGFNFNTVIEILHGNSIFCFSFCLMMQRVIRCGKDITLVEDAQ